MTSSQPVTTPNAINFTPDNKHAYAYSGIIGVTNTVSNLLDFKTNTEYIVGQIQFFYSEHVEPDFDYTLKINGVIVTKFFVNDKFDADLNWFPIIIPPFSQVLLTAQNIADTDSVDQSVIFTGKAYGMTETGFQ